MAGALLALLLLLGRHTVRAVQYRGDFYTDYPDYPDYDYPETSPPPTLALALTNSTFTVRCGEEGGVLQHQGQEVREGGRVEREGGLYTVRGAVATDWGVWECGGRREGRAVLPTVGAVHLLEGAGRTLANGSVLVVREGAVLYPACGLLLGEGGVRPAWPPQWTWEGARGEEERQGEGEGGLVSSLESITVRREYDGLSLGCTAPPLPPALVTLAVHHPPEFTIGRDPGFGSPVWAGSSLALLCSVEASPASPPYWEREGRVLATSGRLHFPNLSPKDEGWYICSTSHSLGNFSSVGYFLSVQQGEQTTPLPGGLEVEGPPCNPSPGAPTLQGPSTVRAFLGAPASLSIEVCSEAPLSTVIWAGPGGLLLGPGQEAGGAAALTLPHSQGCGLAQVVMEGAEGGHGGQWLLLARNRHGISETVVLVSVEEGTGLAAPLDGDSLLQTEGGPPPQGEGLLSGCVRYTCDILPLLMALASTLL